ncbi:MAG: hypothetical protein Q8R39_02735 [bacterium]|nr:hypothetical protein [bacterium]MDZ4284475.1 hypothetical protein [Patescibacteria group bacterium]
MLTLLYGTIGSAPFGLFAIIVNSYLFAVAARALYTKTPVKQSILIGLLALDLYLVSEECAILFLYFK